MARRTFFLFTIAALLAAAGASRASDPGPTLAFAYDAKAPLGYDDRGRINKRSYPIAFHDVSFSSGGRRVPAYLLLPPGKGRRPAVVFVHGSGGDRSELLSQAAWLAARNVVTLTIAEPSTTNPPVPATTQAGRLRQVRDVQVGDVVAIRRAVDLLRARRDVDPSRIGYLGWSAGAKTGALVAASEPHVRALVLLSAGADPLSDFVKAAPVAIRAQAREVLGSIDPIRYIARARPGSVLLENGRMDEIVPRAALQNIVDAAPKGTAVRWYPASHALSKAAYHDAFDWLARKLGVTGPVVRGAITETSPG